MLKGCLRHILQNEGRCLWPVCSLQGGDSGSKRIPAELAGKWREQLASLAVMVALSKEM